MPGVLAVVRAELRRSWRSLLVVALVTLVGISAVMISLAGARRADTSYARFREAIGDGSAAIGVEGAPERLGELDELSEVQAVAPFGYVPIYPSGAPEEATVEGGGFASIDGRWLYDVQRPRVLAGEMPDPSAGDAMAVNEEFVRWFDVEVGDSVPMVAATRAAMASDGEIDEVEELDLEVAAVVRTPLDIGVNVGGPIAYLPPGVLRKHPTVGVVEGYAMVRLEGGDERAAAFEQLASDVFSDEPSYTTIPIREEGRAVERAIDVQVTALLVVGMMTGLATLAFVIQVTATQIGRGASTTGALRPLGATRAQWTLGLATPAMAVVIPSVGLAAISSVLLSSWLPRGLARTTEPNPGRYLDGETLAAVAGAATLLVGAVALVAAARATSPPGEQSDRDGRVGRGAVAWGRRLGARLPLTTGVRMAVPARGGLAGGGGGVAAQAGLVVGVAGLVAAASIGLRLDHVADESGAWGAPFELLVDAEEIDRDLAVADLPGVARVTRASHVERVELGEAVAPGFALQAIEGDVTMTTTDGRAPEAAGEVLLGVRTADELGLGVGDDLRFAAANDPDVQLEVVGLGLLPIVGDNSYDSGMVVHHDDLAHIDDGEALPLLYVDLLPGADTDRVQAALSEMGASASAIEPPGEQINIRATLTYPAGVAILVGIVALAGLTSAIIAGTRTRARELATLRSIGFTPTQVRESVRWEALAVATLGVAVGVPAGLVAAGAGWTAFAESTSLDGSLAISWPVVAGVAMGLAVCAAVVATGVGRRLARRRVAIDLHAE